MPQRVGSRTPLDSFDPLALCTQAISARLFGLDDVRPVLQTMAGLHTAHGTEQVMEF
jgi:hypothetical protein